MIIRGSRKFSQGVQLQTMVGPVSDHWLVRQIFTISKPIPWKIKGGMPDPLSPIPSGSVHVLWLYSPVCALPDLVENTKDRFSHDVTHIVSSRPFQKLSTMTKSSPNQLPEHASDQFLVHILLTTALLKPVDTEIISWPISI